MGKIIDIRVDKEEYYNNLIEDIKESISNKPLAVITIIINRDGSFVLSHTPDEYLLKIGALESAKQDIIMQASGLI